MGERPNERRCPYCGARLIVMRFHENVSYHCQTHGPFALDADGILRADGSPVEQKRDEAEQVKG
jgi:hypothetical protein